MTICQSNAIPNFGMLHLGMYIIFKEYAIPQLMFFEGQHIWKVMVELDWPTYLNRKLGCTNYKKGYLADAGDNALIVIFGSE